MKTCQSCYHFHICLCGDHGWCEMHEEHYELEAPVDDCDYYDGPSDEEDTTERDNPRDPIIERR